MENNKKCCRCGKSNKIDLHFCSNFRMKLTPNNVQPNINNSGLTNDKINNDNSEGTKLGIISAALYFFGFIIVSLISNLLPPSLSDSFSVLGGICPLSGIVVMIAGRVKYPTNKFLKIVMWIIMVSIALGLIAFVVIYISCINIDTARCG